MHQGPKSALFNYILSGYVGQKLKNQFLEQLYHPNNEGLHIERTIYGFTVIDSSKDRSNKKIVPGHKFYELSHVIQSFKEGTRTTKEELREHEYGIDRYFSEKGPHFAAGYLSRFGFIAREKGEKPKLPFEDNITWGFRKFKEKKYLDAAVNVWNDYVQNNSFV
jgi:hypothetical protein